MGAGYAFPTALYCSGYFSASCFLIDLNRDEIRHASALSLPISFALPKLDKHFIKILFHSFQQLSVGFKPFADVLVSRSAEVIESLQAAVRLLVDLQTGLIVVGTMTVK